MPAACHCRQATPGALTHKGAHCYSMKRPPAEHPFAPTDEDHAKVGARFEMSVILDVLISHSPPPELIHFQSLL